MLVSIIVASYNYEKYIGETLDSILAQTYDNFEVIVVDDGSTDNSVALIKEYEKKDKRIKLYQHENNKNKGLPATIQFGLLKAAGEWTAFCESDDYWDKNYLAKKIAYIKKFPDAGLVVNNVNMFGDDKSIRAMDSHQKHFAKAWKKEKPQNLFYYLYDKNILSTFSTVMVRTDLLKNCDFNSPIPSLLDWWLWRQIGFGYKIGGIKEKLTHWRMHPDSYISQKNEYAGSFYKASNNLLKKKYKKEYYKKTILPLIIKKLPLWQKKSGYLRIKIFGITLFKIKLG